MATAARTRLQVTCPEFNCDEVVSLVQKLCENIGAMDLQHDRASVTWICTFLQMRAKDLEDKVEMGSRRRKKMRRGKRKRRWGKKRRKREERRRRKGSEREEERKRKRN